MKIDAAGLNYIDVYFRTGLYKAALPLTLGLEGGGTVTAVGSDVDERDGRRPGRLHGRAGRVRAVRRRARPRGSSCCPRVSRRSSGAAAMLQGMTAHYLA